MTRTSRLVVLSLCGLVIAVAAGVALAVDAAPPVRLETIDATFVNPLFVTYAPGDAERLFIVEQTGRIRVFQGGVEQPPLLDLRGRVSSGFERGLLGLAFHPDFQDNCLIFVNYTDAAGHTRVARYRVQPDAYVAVADSAEILLTIAQPAANHNGGMIAFGPDGYLYIATGDGGRAGDPWGNAQNRRTLLGKLLRIDVDGEFPYGIPASNPFVGDPQTRDEIWALGLRNPWRFSFDRETGDLYIADVGQQAWEEINVEPAGSAGGRNYGWNVMEGAHCYPPGRACDPSNYALPVAEYVHSAATGCSITGGYVYRGRAIPELAGGYLFSDYCTGKVWVMWPDGHPKADPPYRFELLLETGAQVSSFGEDADGELYVTDIGRGRVHKIVPAN